MPQVSDADASANVRRWRGQFDQSGWWHSFELPDGRKIDGVNDIESLKRRLSIFPIAEDLSGKRVLDIGAWDGWFSFEMERRGAEVVSVDNTESANFLYLHRELKSKVEYRILDIYELTPERLGQFDIVLFLGVLYHLKHPLLALERICALTTGFAAVGSYTSPDTGPPIMEYYEIDELGGQFDNWVGPNPSCLLAMCRTAGFARVDLLDVMKHGTSVGCHRHFAAPCIKDMLSPVLRGCVHTTRFGIDFSSKRDDYASCWFDCADVNLDRDTVQIRVGPFDARPVSVTRHGDSWQANFKLPPGLVSGWHEVQVRATDHPWSDPFRIAVDVPLRVETLQITGACDGKSWKPFEVVRGAPSLLSLWVRGVPENGGRDNMRVMIGDRRCRLDYVSPWHAESPAQLNVALPTEMAEAEYPVTVSIGGVVSEPIFIRVCQPRLGQGT
jgi:tRNA (mo5U34)-methyltransferase